MCQCSKNGKTTWIYGIRKQTNKMAYICKVCGEYWESGGIYDEGQMISEGRRYGRRLII